MLNANQFNIVLVTIDDLEKAKEIAKVLVEKKLAACCNILPGLISIYRWEDKVAEDNELLMIIKTSEQNLEELEELINDLHPYDVPEIISYKLNSSSKNYLDWLSDSVGFNG